ncbi:ion transporter [Azomonas macrocytogenes]|uniref:Preprotein translocase subunit SecA n=1 Tax=Azomonas macrocytogenes TaxID=69962 RepID=A0A839T7F8_AZOMA|nr:ion transporter [Azomonas macrocytogenes]MBB3104194.1 hypothetical protein [Azomonas macrocytogenes]
MAEHPRYTPERDRLHALWETFIVTLVCLNLGLLLFDSLFMLAPIDQTLAVWLPQLHGFYIQRIHAHLVQIDLVFIAFFVFDVLFGWAVALQEKRYARWYYYPFAHWYDVLGCIPLGGFRWLRILRVFALLLRLQRLQLIDMRRWAIYGFVNRYYQLLLEEVSDRVMIKVFTRLQQEIGARDDLAQRLIHEVIRPRKQRLLDDLARRLQGMLEGGYHNNRGAIENYVSGLIHQALTDTPKLHNLRRLPLGERLADGIDEALTDIAGRLLQGAVSGLQSAPFQALARNLADQFFEAWLHQEDNTDLALEELLVDIIEVLKQQIVDRHWSNFVGPQVPVDQPV